MQFVHYGVKIAIIFERNSKTRLTNLKFNFFFEEKKIIEQKQKRKSLPRTMAIIKCISFTIVENKKIVNKKNERKNITFLHCNDMRNFLPANNKSIFSIMQNEITGKKHLHFTILLCLCDSILKKRV